METNRIALKKVKNGIYRGSYKGVPIEVILKFLDNHAFSCTVQCEILLAPVGYENVMPVGKVVIMDCGRFARSFRYMKTPNVFGSMDLEAEKMNKEKDMADFKRLLHELASEGRRYEKSDVLTEALGGDKFSYTTRRTVADMVFIIEDNPEFAGMVPEKLREFFEGYKISWSKHASEEMVGGKVLEHMERSLGRKLNVNSQGKAIAEEQKYGEFLVMFPDGKIEHAMDKTQAEQKIKKWFHINRKESDMSVGMIEWRFKTAKVSGRGVMNRTAAAAMEVADHLMRHRTTTPYELKQLFDLNDKEVERIYALLPSAFGPGGEGYSWFSKKIGWILFGRGRYSMNKIAVAKELVKIAKMLEAGPTNVIKTRNIKLEIVDWTDDTNTPAYDVNVTVDGKPVTGGKGVFTSELGVQRAYRSAEEFMDRLIRHLVLETGGVQH